MTGSLANPTSTQRDGLYRLAVTGSGLDVVAAADTETRAQYSAALADAIVAAIARARARGLDAFAPGDTSLFAPVGVPPASLATLFSDVVGVPYRGTPGQTPGYRALALSEWSDAALALRGEAAALRSRLAPGQGGGLNHADGYWYVNGQRYTLAESFLALRFSSYTAVDAYLADTLNRANLNTTAARKLVATVRDLNASYASSGGSNGTYSAQGLVDLLARNGLTLGDVAAWGERVSGGGNFAAVLGDYAASNGAAIDASRYAELITEGKAIFDAFNADNQVSQLRLDSVVNQRQNIVNGMSSFLQGYTNQQATIGRMLTTG